MCPPCLYVCLQRAPTFGPCGMAGGGPTAGVESGEYNLTAFAKQGDLGIHLPEVHSATWKAGGTAETAWYIRANHGGGYVRKARTEQQTSD